jgi:ring-1,2-phenylacetyl-CoA epoxidase subunit PaaE
MNKSFYSLIVSKIEVETKGEALSVYFEIPIELQSKFSWLAGQHVSLRFTLGETEFRRTYTISNSPNQKELRVTVKRVIEGVVSNHINDNLKPGDSVELLAPYGSFLLEPSPEYRRTYYFYAAGSGITPIYSMIEAILHAEPRSVCNLLYANTNYKSIIFRDKLTKLLTKYDAKLTVCHVLSRGSVWNMFQPWATGRIDKNMIAQHFSEFTPTAQDTQYYVCGPGNMNDSICSALTNLDVPNTRIHRESFGGLEKKADTLIRGQRAQAAVLIDGEQFNVSMEENQTLLEAILADGHQVPYSCQSGVCGACRAQLISGEVHLRNSAALSQHEVNSGEILSCQSVASTPTLEVAYS